MRLQVCSILSRSLLCHPDNEQIPSEMGYVSGSPLTLSSYSMSSGNTSTKKLEVETGTASMDSLLRQLL